MEALTNVNSVAAAYIVIWVALLGYLWRVHRLGVQAAEELDRLREELKEKP